MKKKRKSAKGIFINPELIPVDEKDGQWLVSSKDDIKPKKMVTLTFNFDA